MYNCTFFFIDVNNLLIIFTRIKSIAMSENHMRPPLIFYAYF